MFVSDDVAFAWAIGKALLIVIVSFGTLVYAAWAVTYRRKNVVDVEIPEDGALEHRSSVKTGKVLLIPSGTAEALEEARSVLTKTSTEETNVHDPGPAAAA